jgi:hypothetical protein
MGSRPGFPARPAYPLPACLRAGGLGRPAGTESSGSELLGTAMLRFESAAAPARVPPAAPQRRRLGPSFFKRVQHAITAFSRRVQQAVAPNNTMRAVQARPVPPPRRPSLHRTLGAGGPRHVRRRRIPCFLLLLLLRGCRGHSCISRAGGGVSGRGRRPG